VVAVLGAAVMPRPIDVAVILAAEGYPIQRLSVTDSPRECAHGGRNSETGGN